MELVTKDTAAQHFFFLKKIFSMYGTTSSVALGYVPAAEKSRDTQVANQIKPKKETHTDTDTANTQVKHLSQKCLDKLPR